MKNKKYGQSGLAVFLIFTLLGLPQAQAAEFIAAGQGNYMAVMTSEEAQMRYGNQSDQKKTAVETLSAEEKETVAQQLAQLETSYAVRGSRAGMSLIVEPVSSNASVQVPVLSRDEEVNAGSKNSTLDSNPVAVESDLPLPNLKEEASTDREDKVSTQSFLQPLPAGAVGASNAFLIDMGDGGNTVAYNSEEDVRTVENYFAKQTGKVLERQESPGDNNKKEQISLDDARRNLDSDAQNNKEIELKSKALSDNWIKEFVFNLLRLRNYQWSANAAPAGSGFLITVADASRLNAVKSTADAASDYLLAFLIQASAVYIEPSAEKFTGWFEQNESVDWKLIGNQIKLLRRIRATLENSARKGESDAARKKPSDVIETVELSDRTAALHILNNLPQMHPFFATLLRKAQLSDDEKLEYLRLVTDIYRLNHEASKDKELFIRYKNQTFQGFLPELGDADGTYELVKGR